MSQFQNQQRKQHSIINPNSKYHFPQKDEASKALNSHANRLETQVTTHMMGVKKSLNTEQQQKEENSHRVRSFQS